MSSDPKTQITEALDAVRAGLDEADERLLSLVYGELKALARSRLAGEQAQTLQPTALVHEAWLRLVGDDGVDFQNRRHFFGAAARSMRRILVDQARRRSVRGERVDAEVEICVEPPDLGVLDVDAALGKLEQSDPRKAEIVNLRYFAGLSNAETAAAMDLSVGTIEREWRFIRALLRRELERD